MPFLETILGNLKYKLNSRFMTDCDSRNKKRAYLKHAFFQKSLVGNCFSSPDDVKTLEFQCVLALDRLGLPLAPLAG